MFDMPNETWSLLQQFFCDFYLGVIHKWRHPKIPIFWPSSLPLSPHRHLWLYDPPEVTSPLAPTPLPPSNNMLICTSFYSSLNQDLRKSRYISKYSDFLSDFVPFLKLQGYAKIKAYFNSKLYNKAYKIPFSKLKCWIKKFKFSLKHFSSDHIHCIIQFIAEKCAFRSNLIKLSLVRFSIFIGLSFNFFLQAVCTGISQLNKEKN